MKEAVSAPPLAADDLFAGILAALVVSNRPEIRSSRSALHRAFYDATRRPEIASELGAVAALVDFDPLYGVSPWLDRALTEAQRDLLVNFPNPSYDRIDIRLEVPEAEEILNSLNIKRALLSFADAFWSNLKVTA